MCDHTVIRYLDSEDSSTGGMLHRSYFLPTMTLVLRVTVPYLGNAHNLAYFIRK